MLTIAGQYLDGLLVPDNADLLFGPADRDIEQAAEDLDLTVLLDLQARLARRGSGGRALNHFYGV